jgi:hypothetical protein
MKGSVREYGHSEQFLIKDTSLSQQQLGLALWLNEIYC